MKTRKILLQIIFVLSFFLASSFTNDKFEVLAQEAVIENLGDNYKQHLDLSLNYLLDIAQNPTFGTLNGEWTILSLARSNFEVPNDYYSKYYKNIEVEVDKLMKQYNNKLDRSKGSEHSRLIIALTAIKKDINDVNGYDILEAFADYNFMIRQGINGPIFALIALNTHNYQIPIDKNVSIQASEEMYIDYILNNEITRNGVVGGWALGGSNPDPDITAMALQALSPYYHKNNKVKLAVDRAIDTLSNMQDTTGGYRSWGTLNSESVAQVIVALSSLDIDAHRDERFIKNNNSALDSLMSFASENGGFKHTLNNNVNGMATDQGIYSLVAYDRFINKQTALYDMSDITLDKDNIIFEDYFILSGDNISLELNEKATISIKVDADVNEFVEVRVNDEILSEDNYLVQSGSTIITFKNTFLKTLNLNEVYNVELIFKEGSAKTTFKLLEINNDEPKKDNDEIIEDKNDNSENDKNDEVNEDNNSKDNRKPHKIPNTGISLNKSFYSLVLLSAIMLIKLVKKL